MALGAQPRQIAWTSVGRVLACVGAGLVLGSAGALAVGRAIEDLLFRIPPVDPPTLLLMPLVFATLAAVACLGPVRRAVLLDPSDVFRIE